MDFVGAIRRESDRFYAAADGSDPALRVPSCPDWNLADLVWHLAGVHWFWTEIIENRATAPDALGQAKPARPSDYADLIAWGRAQAERLCVVLASTADDVPVWTWAQEQSDHTVGFIRRHQVQEVAVHRWDLQRAAGSAEPDAIDAAVAADAIDEMLAITLPWSVGADKPLPGSVHLHCTDTEGEWFVHPEGGVEAIHAKGDVAIRGAASDLLLALYKRESLDAVELIGDASLAHELVARLNTG